MSIKTSDPNRSHALILKGFGINLTSKDMTNFFKILYYKNIPVTADILEVLL